MYSRRVIREDLVYPDLSYKIVGVLYSVFNELGYGYQEKYYERAVANNFKVKELIFKRQVPYIIRSNGKIIGRYYLDFLVAGKVILELKKGNYFNKQNIDQVNAYLKATNLKLAILANFTPHGVKFMRLVNLSKFL
ncbi:MAG: GxxExxY protein [bacterium]|nr:GxxExxY protein [bacterium]